MKKINFPNVHEIKTFKDRSLKIEMGITLGVESTLLRRFISSGPSLLSCKNPMVIDRLLNEISVFKTLY